MTDDEYIARELNKAAPTGPGDVVRIKARGNHGESRWTLIPADRFAALVAAASTPSVNGKRCRYCSDELYNVTFPVGITEHEGFCGANPTSNHHVPEES
jgi:hypothetical protein